MATIRAALFDVTGADDDAMGNLAEIAVWSQWLHSAQVSRALHCYTIGRNLLRGD